MTGTGAGTEAGAGAGTGVDGTGLSISAICCSSYLISSYLFSASISVLLELGETDTVFGISNETLLYVAMADVLSLKQPNATF